MARTKEAKEARDAKLATPLPVKRPIGRPRQPVPMQHKIAIAAWIAEGKPLQEYCRQPGAPAWRTVYEWQDRDPEFFAMIARARDIGADRIAEQALEILDEIPAMTGADGEQRIDPAFVTWQRNRAEYRLKLLAKWNPRKYGDTLRTEVTGANGGPIALASVTIDARQLAPEQRETLRAALLATKNNNNINTIEHDAHKPDED